jgi:hypothetical protein
VAINPFTSVSITGYNSSPPPDDGSQTSANKVEWAKHKTKLADPLKALAEGINTNAIAACNALALEDWVTVTTTATIAESDWNGGQLITASCSVNYPDPANFENGWHNYIYNGSTGVVALQATATGFFRRNDGGFASEYLIQPGKLAKVFNTATQWLAQGGDSPVFRGISYQFTSTFVTATELFTSTMGHTATCGTQFLSLTYSNAEVGNLLEVESQIFTITANNTNRRAAIFAGTATSSTPISTSILAFSGTDHLQEMSMRTWVTCTATAYTFLVRGGPNAGTHYLNGNSGWATDISPRVSYLKVTEYDT